MKSYPTNYAELVKDSSGNPLICSGCAHSAASAPFPGQPSGERPCCFCTRNAQRKESLREMAKYYRDGVLPEKHPAFGVWYDGSAAIKVPMDCYHSVDMKDQILTWSGRPCEEGDVVVT